MCRLFALKANRPTRVRGSLLANPHSLRQQSCCDLRSRTHDSGWGIGHYRNGKPHRVRSPLPCGLDTHFGEVAADLVAATVVAHVRLASVGSVAEQNSHPFLHGPWLFAHNGTLVGFEAHPDPLTRLIPLDLRQDIEGVTDSEHAFYVLLARLEQVPGTLEGPERAEAVGGVFRDTIRTLAELYPGEGDERTQINFVLTDGEVLLASRWGHSLFWLENRGNVLSDSDGPVEPGPDYHGIAVASEPTSSEAWMEIPEHSVLQVFADQTHTIAPI